MRIFLRSALSAVLWLSIAALFFGTAAAAPQDGAGEPPASLARIKGELAKAPGPQLKATGPIPAPVATFKSRVDQRVFVPTLQEHLRKEFALTPMQRQSAEWAAKCCGLNLGQVGKIASDAQRARTIRKTRQEIARELAELEAARQARDPVPR